MKKPTEAQIKKEIETLRDYQSRVRPYTSFGDSNVDAIGAQIKVLEEEMDEDAIWDEWLDDEDDRLRDVALETFQWINGEADRPSKEWKPLLQDNG